ncbi:MAG: SDR family NAD(P)-dependent oxidoreductase [Candidatus Omnitrophica bacterium]|nr:SDR family NAD(P)-dependent oxidoreductase [Candidatus Omnitrophota bacterium]
MNNALFSGKSILISGGTGFLGMRLAEKLISCGAKIIIVDQKAPAENCRKKLKADKQMARFIKCDLTNQSEVKKIKSKIKNRIIVVHLAAFVPPSADPNEDFIGKSIEVNIKAGVELCEGISGLIEKICYVSTLDVYGYPEYIPVDEGHPTNPVTYYGASKLSGEKYLQVLSKRKNIPLTVLRFSCTYGQGEWYNRAIPNFIRAAIDKKDLIVYGDGSDARDYLFLDDAIEAVVLALQKDKSGIYNIGSGRLYSIKEIAEKIIKITGENVSLKLRPRLKKRTKFVFNISKAKKQLGYKPKAAIADGLKQEIEWFKSLKEGAKSESIFS